MTIYQKTIKRGADIVLSFMGIFVLLPFLSVGYLIASISTGRNGIFFQKRVGREGKIFSVIKLRTMKTKSGISTTVTVKNDPRITKTGTYLRKLKIDEIPQLFNVLAGHMSLVGPRPDVSGFADRLIGDDRKILELRPGITGPATLKYKKEEQFLSDVEDPEIFNRDVIWPDKVRINLEYIENYSLLKDVYFIFKTIFG